MKTASSCLFGDLVPASKFAASRASYHWMLDPHAFCAIAPGSASQASRPCRPARNSLHQTSAVTAQLLSFTTHGFVCG